MAHYDLYDYQSYWQGRSYEDGSEKIAIKAFFDQIGQNKLKLLEVGSGFGRLVPAYSAYCSQITLLDPAQKNLTDAKSYLHNTSPPIKYVKGRAENIPFPPNTFDAALIVRVLHHIPDPAKVLSELSRVIKPGGYLILEFANKLHLKNIFTSFINGKFDLLSRLHPLERRSKANIRKETIPFVNHHPRLIESQILQNNFQIISKKSVSNLRIGILKNTIQLKPLLAIEQELQSSPLVNSLQLSPSIFILARKNS